MIREVCFGGLPGVLCTLQSSRGKEGEGTLRAEQRDAGEEREELFLLEWTAESKMFLYKRGVWLGGVKSPI